MRLSLLPTAILAAALLSPMSLQSPLAAAPAAAAQARVIVTFKPDAPLARRHALAAGNRAESAAQLSAERASVLGQRAGVGLRGGGHVSDRTQVMFASGISSAQLVQRLAADGDVESVVIDQRRHRFGAPNDPLYPDGQPASPGPAVGQWYLRAPAGAVQSSINVEAAWAVTTGRPEVVVAVLDTGVRYDHADLTGSLLPGFDMVHDAVVAGDGSGPGPDGTDRDADASDPGDFVTAEEIAANPSVFSGCTPSDSSWHGTQTASLIGALTDNGIGMASVGRNVRVLPVRVLGKCGGYDSDIQAAMLWAAGLHVPGVPDNPNKAAVINLSLGSSGTCGNGYPAVISQVMAAGTVVIAAAGNSIGQAVGVPANCPGVIAVGGLRHAGTKVGYADAGPEIALSAPAGNCVNIGNGQACLYPIIAALNVGATTPVAGSSIYSDSQNWSVGTSFSAPLVAGTAALMLAIQPALQPADLRRLLQSTARPFPTTSTDPAVLQCQAPSATDQLECICTASTCGAGMLDAGAAVQAAQNGVVARIDVTPAAPLAGQPIELSAAGSTVAQGRTIASTHWTLTDGGGIVTGFTGSADSATAEVIPAAAGQFSVSLTVVDSAGASSAATLTIVVGAEPVSSGGGGAMGLPWLIALAVSVLLVAQVSRQRA